MTFNAQEFMDQTGGAGLAAGWNDVKVDGVLQKTSAKGNLLLQITLKGRSGQCWLNLNINHPNPKADEIARRELAALMIACGCNSVRDPANPVELQGKYCQALLEEDGSFLRPKSYKPMTAAQPTPAPAFDLRRLYLTTTFRFSKNERRSKNGRLFSRSQALWR